MFSSNGDSANAILRFNSDCQPSVLKEIRSEHKSLNKDIDNIVKYIKKNIEIQNIDSMKMHLERKYHLFIEGHTNRVSSIVITSDNKYIISGSWDQTVRIWNLQDKSQEAVLRGHTGYVKSIVITRDNKYIITGSDDRTIRIWNFEARSQAAVLIGHTKSVWSVAISSNSKYIASGFFDHSVRLWNFKEKYQTWEKVIDLKHLEV